MSKAKIEELLTKTFSPTHLLVVDESHKHAGHAKPGQGGHFAVEIQSPFFSGKGRLERHRMIYAALAPIQSSIHALAIKVNG